MVRESFWMLLKRKFFSLLTILIGAAVITAVLVAIYQMTMYLLPTATSAQAKAFIASVFENPEQLKQYLLQKGQSAPWIFIGFQILQVVIAPIPGQVVALAGGFVFGMWKGLWLTMLGLTLGSFIAMGLSRLLGVKFVRRFVSQSLLNRFDNLTANGGYTTFFMIFLLPALPDDAVCFMAGLTKLKLLPLSIVCLLGRTPGMAVLSLVGNSLSSGLTTGVKVLFVVMMLLSVVLWLFWEYVQQWVDQAWRKF